MAFSSARKSVWAKYSLWERATRVNMVWVAPGVTQPGTTCNKPVNLLDIYPTLASLTGCEPPENQLEGNDLSVLMKDPVDRMGQDLPDYLWLQELRRSIRTAPVHRLCRRLGRVV